MKYLTYLALVGLAEAKTALVIDEEKIIATASSIEGAVIEETSRPEAQAVAEALQAEIEKAALKVDLSMNKLVTPVLRKAADEVEMFGFNEDCKVHKFYQCLVDQGIEYSAYWMGPEDSTCFDEYNCYVPANEPDFDWEEFDQENREFEKKMKKNTRKVFKPIAKSFEKAFVEQQANVAAIGQNLGPALKNILTTYGCDSACLESVPLDVVSIAQATEYCSCPSVIEVQSYNMKSMDISKVLKANNVPEVFKKRMVPETATKTGGYTINLVSTPEVVPQQTSYVTSGLFFAAMFAAGFVYGKNQKTTKVQDDSFSALI